MDFVRTKDDIINNTITFEQYMRSSDSAEREFAENLLRTGKKFLVYKVEGENHFAPNGFVAYKKNTMKDYISNEGKEKIEANPELDKILKVSSFTNPKTEEKFLSYVDSKGIKPEDADRKYWRLKDSRGKNFDFNKEDFQ